MRTTLVLILAVIFMMPAAVCQAQFSDLVWSDEFEEDGLPDSEKWNYDVGGDGWGNNELQYYTENRRKNARVENGNLIIEAHKENYENNTYTSARLVTRGKADWTYGRIEVRAKLPEGVGTWPAIWMLPTDWIYGNGSWPDNGEIDIMEHVGYDPGVIHGSIHTNAYNHTDGTQKGGSINVPTAMDDFHTYALEWTEDKLTWLVDGEKYFTYHREGTGWETWPFDHDFHLLLNIAVGGDWGGVEGVNADAFPVRMVVDYVRVYKEATSFGEAANEESFRLHTNALKNCCRVAGDQQVAEAKLVDMQGTVQWQKNFATNSRQFNINTGELARGIYILRMKTSSGALIHRRLVRQ